MALFSKGSWTRLAVSPEDLTAWTAFTDSPKRLFISSSLVARSLILAQNLETSIGINPPKWPCGDSPLPTAQRDLDKKLHPAILNALNESDNEEPWDLSEDVLDSVELFDLVSERYFGSTDRDFRLLDTDTPVYGFWLVLMKRTGLDDLKALREHAAATSIGKPFGLLSQGQKKEINESLVSDGLIDYIERSQVPVIMDFRTGDVWVGSTSKKHLEAFKFWMGRNPQITLYRTELKPGSSESWAQEALAVFVEKDRDKLERREAYEKAKKILDEGEPEPEDEDVYDEIPGVLPKVEEEEDDAYTLTDLAVYADDGGCIATVSAEGSITFSRVGKSTVGVSSPMDALEILYNHRDATVVAASVQFSSIVNDQFVNGSVSFDSSLLSGAFKGLDLHYPINSCEFIESSDPLLNVRPLMDELRSTDSKSAHAVNRQWYRYYLLILDFNSMMIETVCSALSLDPNLVTLTVPHRDAAVQEIKDEQPVAVSPKVLAAAKKLKQSFQANLHQGESVTLTSAGRSVTIESNSIQQLDV